MLNRDKHSTRTTMAAAGLPTPRNFLIEQESQVEEAAELVKFPAGAAEGLICNRTADCKVAA